MSPRATKVTRFLPALALLLASARAAASPVYPADIQDLLQLDCAPACTLCHLTTEGGYGTAIQPFGVTMQGAGLTAKTPSALRPALVRINEEAIDSDGDGETDASEIVQLRDPNVVGKGSLCGVQYGCAARVARRPPDRHSGLALLCALTLAAWLGRAALRRRVRGCADE